MRNALPGLALACAAWCYQGGSVRLAVGDVRNAALRGGGSDRYILPLRPGDFVSAVAEQRGVDVEIILSAPDGQRVAHSDLPNNDQGPEPIVAIAETAGDYQLVIRALNPQAPLGHYQLRVDAIRPATAEDRRRVQTERLVDEAEALRTKRTAESMSAAIAKNQEALAYFQSAGDRYRQALTLKQIGLLHALLGDFRAALEADQPALDLFRAVGDRIGEASVANNTGGAYDMLGEVGPALAHFDVALKLYRAGGERASEANVLNNIGKIYTDMADWQRATQYYRQALRLLEESGNKTRQAGTLHNLGGTTRHTDLDAAAEYYRQAMELRRAIQDRAGEAATLAELSSLRLSTGAIADAIQYGEQALALNRAIGNRAGEARTLRTLGGAYVRAGKIQRGRELLEEALATDRRSGDRREESLVLLAIGASQDATASREFYRKSADIAAEIGASNTQAAALEGIARAERDLGNVAEARRYGAMALDLTETVRARSGGEQARAGYLSDALERYQFFIDVLMLQHEDAAALEASERSHARSLLEMLSESGVDIREGVDPQLLAREREISNRLNARGTRLLAQSGRDNAQATALRQEIRALETEYQDVQSAIRQNSPHYAALTQPGPLSLKEIRQDVLDPDSVLLEYSLSEPRSYLWTVTRDELHAWQLPARSEIEAQVAEVYSLLTARALTRRAESPAERQKRIGQADAALPESARKLSRMVIDTAASAIAGKRLVIVPDGALQRLPFAILQAVGEPEPLVASHEIVMLPSASALAVLRREAATRKPPSKLLAVFADPAFDGGRAPSSPEASRILEHLVEPGSSDGASWKIPRLPYTAQEADQILRVAGGSSNWKATGYQASRAAALNGQLGDYRYVHFATHGLLDTERPTLSALVLAQVDAKGQPQDGFLRVGDIYNTRLSADLVVLSACQTGLGKEVRGEGLMGLTRAFLYAGAPRVVVSLWNVNDRATADLMAALYRRMLREGKRPSAALREAQAEMRKQARWEAPYYWAAFVQHGDWQ
jgi:CHAT domain-containing protein/Tfp pilus assembly protein PilF